METLIFKKDIRIGTLLFPLVLEEESTFYFNERKYEVEKLKVYRERVELHVKEFSDSINDILRERREKELKESDQLTLGLFIEKLEKCDLNKTVCFDFGKMLPIEGGFHSYRGNYRELALDFKDVPSYKKEVIGHDLLKESKGALMEEFTGWKGGDFLMTEETPLWVSHQGFSSKTMIVDVKESDDCIIICTSHSN